MSDVMKDKDFLVNVQTSLEKELGNKMKLYTAKINGQEVKIKRYPMLHEAVDIYNKREENMENWKSKKSQILGRMV